MSKMIPVQIIQFSATDGSFITNERPIILRGGAKHWPAFRKWSPEFFTEHYGLVELPLSNYKQNPYQSSKDKLRLPIKDYLKSAQKIASELPDKNEDLYSAGWFFSNQCSELLNDLDLPEYFRRNWAEKAQEILRFETRAILFGHPKVESPLHTDSFFVSTYFAMIRGQKRMRLVSPRHTPYVFNGLNVFDDQKIEELFRKGVEVYDCVIEEGDIVWFPPGWWHHVKNDGFTISVTTNFVAPQHFLPFEQQVRATLLKPLLKLNSLKNDCLKETGEQFLQENLTNSKFTELESAYVNYFREELGKTESLLQKIAQSKVIIP